MRRLSTAFLICVGVAAKDMVAKTNGKTINRVMEKVKASNEYLKNPQVDLKPGDEPFWSGPFFCGFIRLLTPEELETLKQPRNFDFQ